MAHGAADAGVVSIRRDSIEGRGTYSPMIRDMHFGKGRVCRSVTRSGWTPAMQERGLVYCEGRECILVPTACRNVSRILRATVGDEGVDEPPGPPTGPPLADAGPTPLPFPAPPAAPEGEPTFASAGGTPDGPVPGGGEPPWGGGGTWPGGPPPVVPTILPPILPPIVSPPPVGPPPPIPEPETWAIVLAGLAVLAWVQRRMHRSGYG
ncbi:MAG: MHFG family PEP-CTERM protein [Caldimonas sp.]